MGGHAFMQDSCICRAHVKVWEIGILEEGRLSSLRLVFNSS